MSSTQSTLLCHYRYDPLDRLIHHSQVNAPTQQRFYCKSRLATEIQGAMQHSIIQHGDLLLAQQQRLGDKVSTTLLSTDLQRSVLHTLEKNHQQQAIAYSPYGHRRAESSFTSLLCFNGERPDPVTGHYLLGNGYRAFNSVLMRFNSPDSLSPFGKGGLNSYVFCLGDPSNRNDRTGHYSINSLATALLTKRVKSLDGRYYVKIKDNVNIFDALRARDGLKYINRQLNTNEEIANTTFDADYANRYVPQETLPSLKDLTHAKILGNGISNTAIKALEANGQAVPPGIKTILSRENLRTPHSQVLEHLKSDYTSNSFSYAKLLIPPDHINNLPAFKSYKHKILSIRDPYLRLERERLTNQYFSAPLSHF